MFGYDGTTYLPYVNIVMQMLFQYMCNNKGDVVQNIGPTMLKY